MGQTKIEWCDKVWNPITGCSKISPGCQNCYAERMSKRLAGRAGYPKDDPFAVTFHPDKLHEPGSWQKPSRIFVCSMGDLFHDRVEWEWVFQILQIAGMMERHTFMVLTKRPERMLKELKGDLGFHLQRQYWCKTWPLPNIYLGVTVENNDHLWRVEYLLQIPAAVRFVSIEPMLGPVNLTCVPGEHEAHYAMGTYNFLTGSWWPAMGDADQEYRERFEDENSLDWVICGGETGPGARPMHPDWVRQVRDDCQAAGVPFFFKQWGVGHIQGSAYPGNPWHDAGHNHLLKNGGRLLDGREWNEIPEKKD